MKILTLYHSYDDQTARIAKRIGKVLGDAGHEVTVQRFFGPGDLARLDDFDAVVVGAAIRYGHHERALERAIRSRSARLASRPNAFFSVCLSAGGPGYKPKACKRYIDEFVKATGWHPDAAASFAGALQWSKYHNPFIKFMMKLIVGYSGGETDASRDYEYTDWPAVERFAREFSGRLAQNEHFAASVQAA